MSLPPAPPSGPLPPAQGPRQAEVEPVPVESVDRVAAPLIRPSRPTVGDIVLAAAALLFAGPLATAGFGVYSAPSVVLAVVASVIMPVAVAFRRTHPAPSAIVVYTSALIHFVAGVPVIPTDILIFVSLYSVTVYGPTWARRAGLAGALVGCLLQGLALLFLYGVGEPSDVVSTVLSVGFLSAVVLAVWALALVRRARVERLRTLAERARRLEVERDQQAQIATAAERARIAREMHDVVAHSLAVVISQADGGRYAAPGDPAAAERALTTIAETGRSALGDLRRILGVLRDEDDTVALAPQPTEHDLQTLLTPLRHAGLDVTLQHTGTPRTVPAPIGLGIYRIVQESLTNVLKHAGPAASAEVMLHWHPDHLDLMVSDTGSPGSGSDSASAGAHGHGLVGMAERATMLGGTLQAGPQPAGGWLVRARIPVPPAPDTLEGRAQ